MPNGSRYKTVDAVEAQLRAMGAEVFEVGLFKPNPPDREPIMLPRVWDHDSVLRSIGWLRHQNRDGRNIYLRPKGEHNLSLVDDLTVTGLTNMMTSGFAPAVIVETSPGNFQAWLKHSEQLNKEISTAAARALAHRFGGDRGAADWRHYGRVAGFTNQKLKYRDPITGLHPFVRLIEAGCATYPAACQFLSQVRTQLEEQHRMEQERREVFSRRLSAAVGEPRRFKSINEFRNDSRYEGDGTRIDLAFAIYALSHGATTAEVEAAIRSRDLSHKGSDKRQADYVERTVKKALATAERGRWR